MKDIVISIDDDCNNFEPNLIKTYTESCICESLFETIVKENNRNEIIAAAADYYEISENGAIFKFYFKGKSFWSNGNKLTAYDFEYTFKRILDYKNKNCNAQLLYGIKNAYEYNTLEITDFDKVGIKAVNNELLVIELEYPISYFLRSLTNISLAPMCKDNKGNEIISNGPFMFDEHIIDKYIKVKKNPYFFNSKNKNVDNIIFKIVKNKEEQLRLYENNSIHITCNTMFDFSLIDSFKNRSDFFMDKLSIGYYLYININNVDLFKSEKARKDVYKSIDKNKILKKLSYGVDELDGFIPGILNNYSSIRVTNVCNDGYEKDNLGGYKEYKLTIKYSDYYPNKIIVSEIKRMLESILNLKIKLKKVTLDDLTDSLAKNDYEMILALTPANYNDPSCFFETYIDHDAFNEFDKERNEYDDTIIKIIKDYKDKNKLFRKLDEILLKVLPSIPLFSSKSIYLKKDCIKDLYIYSSGFWDFSNLDLE